MIKIFRNIRQKLLAEGKTINYFKYAIGEIILVMIGILLALQVNNWNNNRIDLQEEQKALKSIHSEFKRNADQLSEIISDTDNSIKTVRKIMGLINSDLSVLQSQNIDSLIYKAFEYGAFNLSENSIQEILQSGKFQNLKNDNLKSLIIEWTQKKNRTNTVFENISIKTENLVTYLFKKYPLKDIDMYGILAWKEPSKSKINKYLIFSDLEFENIIDDWLYNLIGYNNRMKDLKELVNNIIETTETTP